MKLLRTAMLVLLAMMIVVSLSATDRWINEQDWSLHVESSNRAHTTLTLSIEGWRATPVEIDGQSYHIPAISKMEKTFEKGSPALPKLSRSLIIPAVDRMAVRVTGSSFTDYPLTVAPSKGVLPRSIDPATVAYSFGPAYESSEAWPREIATLGEPYIMHNARGVTVTIHPMQYLPQQGVLRVYDNISVEVFADGEDNRNVLVNDTETADPDWDSAYAQRFINYPLNRYTLLPEQGRQIIICHDVWLDEIAPLATWKNQRGLQTDVYPVSAIGANSDSIKAFIEAQYNLNDGLAFVTLVGDAAQIPPRYYGPYAADPLYGCINPGDYYPDLFIGRISAQSNADVATQVERFITYERDLTGATWLAQGVGVASALGAGQGDDGESDWQHMDYIRIDLLGYTYSQVDRIYDTNGGTASDVMTSLNAGRSVVNYCGHGSTSGWGTTGFSNSHINSLTNADLLPFVYSVACLNGNFTNYTCFAETWMRATDVSENPTGAVGIYASSNNQSWAPPMCAQDEFADLLCAETLDAFGALCFNSSCQMMDEYGSSGEAVFRTWHVFGDPTLLVRTADPDSLLVTAPASLFAGAATISVNAGVAGARVGLSMNGVFVANETTDVNGDATLTLPQPASSGETYHLVVTARNHQTWQGDIAVGAAPPVSGVRAAMSGDELHITWDAYPGATSYKVYYSLYPEGPFMPLTTRSAPVCELTPGSTIPDLDRLYFQVTAELPD